MSQGLRRIARRRLQLQAMSSLQRQQLQQALQPWQQPLALADRALALLHALSRHPLWLLAGAGAIAALSPGRTRLWLQRGWIAAHFVYTLIGKSRKTSGAIT